jgi:hypothetical protein
MHILAHVPLPLNLRAAKQSCAAFFSSLSSMSLLSTIDLAAVTATLSLFVSRPSSRMGEHARAPALGPVLTEGCCVVGLQYGPLCEVASGRGVF